MNIKIPAIGLYRHFKGDYFYVNNITKASEDYSVRVTYFNVCKPEIGMFSRPLHEFFSTTDKLEKDDSDVWFECGVEIKERKDNVTGQIHRFEKVKDLNFQLGSITTEQLIDELRRRKDSPIHELDIEGLRSNIYSVDYVVGKKFAATEDTPAGIDTINVFFNEGDAHKYYQDQVAKSRKGVFKRVFIECD